MVKEKLAYTKKDLAQAKECADKIIDIINEYDLKPILLASVLGLHLKDVEARIDELLSNETPK